MAPAQSPVWRRRFRNQFQKTQLCRFNAVGQCSHGQNCSFAHSPGELKSVPDLTKTALCLAWQRGQCPLAAADCHFAHGSEELRLTLSFNNTTLSQRTRAAQENSHHNKKMNLLDLTKLAEDVLSDSTGGSMRSGSMSCESASSCDLTQKERSSTSPRSVTSLEDEALMSRADPRSLPFPYLLPAPPGLGPPVQPVGRPMLPPPPGLGPPRQSPGKAISCHAAPKHSILATNPSALAPQMASTSPTASPAAIQLRPMQDPYSPAWVTRSESLLHRQDSFRPEWLYS